MSPDDKAAALWVTQQGSGTASGSSPTGTSSAAPGGGGPKIGDSTPGGTIAAAKATLTQTGTVTTTGGTRYPASTTGLTTTTRATRWSCSCMTRVS